jgi:hypothetical protein
MKQHEKAKRVQVKKPSTITISAAAHKQRKLEPEVTEPPTYPAAESTHSTVAPTLLITPQPETKPAEIIRVPIKALPLDPSPE